MGLTWGVAGAFLGFLMEFVDPHGEIADIWPAVFAYPGFFGGVLFSVVLGIAARHRRFDELSIPRFAAWGALGGLLVSLIPLTMVGLGLASANISIWKITAMLAGPLTIGSAVAASGSLALARMAEPPGQLGSANDSGRIAPAADDTSDEVSDQA
jgi:uncharacterized membrane protein YjfL (UPF0719 family)